MRAVGVGVHGCSVEMVDAALHRVTTGISRLARSRQAGAGRLARRQILIERQAAGAIIKRLSTVDVAPCATHVVAADARVRAVQIGVAGSRCTRVVHATLHGVARCIAIFTARGKTRTGDRACCRASIYIHLAGAVVFDLLAIGRALGQRSHGIIIVVRATVYDREDEDRGTGHKSFHGSSFPERLSCERYLNFVSRCKGVQKMRRQATMDLASSALSITVISEGRS